MSGESGVSSGILITMPERASIAAWPPGPDHYGNSKVETWTAERIADYTGWSVFSK
nr:glutaminase [uncultured Aliiroseovarius sp.]